eukprot:Nk52_evm33s151 gene=Nk52_evmTU33s151
MAVLNIIKTRRDSESDYDEDEFLQQQFAEGKIQRQLVNVQNEEDGEEGAPVLGKKKVFANDQEGLKKALESFKLPYSSDKDSEWIERLDYTSTHPVVIENVEDDLKRELAFYNQALEASLSMYEMVEKLGIKAKRPEDYFAEMVKTDNHMRRVRERILDEKKAMDRSEQAKKVREMKKFGKQVQTEVLKERQKKKADDLEALKKYRKGQANKPGFLDDQQFNIDVEDDGEGNKNANKRKADGGAAGKNAKRVKKDAKYGFGGKKKYAKRNDGESSADISGFNVTKNKSLHKGMKQRKSMKGGKAGKGKAQRPGKSHRAKSKKR